MKAAMIITGLRLWTGKDAQAATKNTDNPKDSFGQGISALGTLYHFHYPVQSGWL